MKVTIELEAQDMVEGIGKTILEAMQVPGKAVVTKAEPVKSTPEPAKTEPVEAEKPKVKPAPKKQEKKPEPVKEVEPEVEEPVEVEPEPEKPKRTKAEIKELLTQFCMEQEAGAAKVQKTFKELGISKLSEASEDQLATIAEKLGL